MDWKSYKIPPVPSSTLIDSIKFSVKDFSSLPTLHRWRATMRPFHLLAAAIYFLGIAEATPTSNNSCKQDTCCIQIKKLKVYGGLAAILSQDCSSFLRITVTPTTKTVTSTIIKTSSQTKISTSADIVSQLVSVTTIETHTITQTQAAPTTIITTTTITAEAANKARRAKGIRPDIINATVSVVPRRVASAHMIPNYASGCSVPALFSSVCSCALGVTASTITAATPTTATTVTKVTTGTLSQVTTQDSFTTVTTVITVIDTVVSTQTIPTTVTDVVTTTVQPVPTYTCANFLLQAVGGQFDGQYAYSGNSGDGFGDYVISFTGSQSSATTYNLDKNSYLNDGNGQYANVNTGASQATLYFTLTSNIDASFESFATCSASTGLLSCAAGSNNEIQECPSTGFGGIELNPSPQSGCVIQTLQIINYSTYICT